MHKSRNVSNYLRKKEQEQVLSVLKTVYQATNKQEALKRYRVWAEKWRNTYPKAVKCVERDIEDLLRFMEFPPEHRKKIRTTNAIERFFKEVRRRTRPISCF